MKTLIEKTSDKLVNAFLKNKIIAPIPSKFSKKISEAQKLEITLQLESDYKSGMLSVEQLTWIINQKKFGSYTAKLILDDMLKKKIIRKNPLTGENKPFIKPKGVFDF